jgi:hypothetical protein
MACLFQPERCHAADEVDVWIVVGELAKHPQRPIAEVGRVAQEEVELMTEHECEHIGGPLRQKFVELRRRAVPITVEPCTDRSRVGAFALVGGYVVQLAPRRARRGKIVGIGAHQVEVGGQCRRHRNRVAVPGEFTHEFQHVGVKSDQAIDRPVVQGDGVGISRHGVAVNVETPDHRGHGTRSVLAPKREVIRTGDREPLPSCDYQHSKPPAQG